MTTALAAVAASWGVAMALAPLLQIRKILAHRSSRDVSRGYLRVLVVGFALWLAYGFASDQLALIVPNGVALGVGIVTLGIASRYRER